MIPDPRHRIGLHHSNHLIDVMDTWPATRRRRFPFGLRRDVFKGWVLSEAIVERGELKELPMMVHDAGPFSWIINDWIVEEWDGTFAKRIADWKATQYAEYRIKRGYVSTLSKEGRLK